MIDRFFADGLDTTPFLERVEREFNIRIPDEDATRINMLGQLCEYVVCKVNEERGNGVDDWIWVVIRRMTSDEFGVAENELHKDIRFVEDLMC